MNINIHFFKKGELCHSKCVDGFIKFKCNSTISIKTPTQEINK